jgi:hypothetical protein
MPCSRGPPCRNGRRPRSRSPEPMARRTLVIGNKAYSSWSLRGWLGLKQTGLPFEEILIPLDRPESAAALAKHSPSRRVPVLVEGPMRIWETIAIIEHLADTVPDARLWPEDRARRAHARAIAAEMHSGFANLRRHLPRSPASRRSGPSVSRRTRRAARSCSGLFRQPMRCSRPSPRASAAMPCRCRRRAGTIARPSSPIRPCRSGSPPPWVIEYPRP